MKRERVRFSSNSEDGYCSATTCFHQIFGIASTSYVVAHVEFISINSLVTRATIKFILWFLCIGAFLLARDRLLVQSTTGVRLTCAHVINVYLLLNLLLNDRVRQTSGVAIEKLSHLACYPAPWRGSLLIFSFSFVVKETDVFHKSHFPTVWVEAGFYFSCVPTSH